MCPEEKRPILRNGNPLTKRRRRLIPPPSACESWVISCGRVIFQLAQGVVLDDLVSVLPPSVPPQLVLEFGCYVGCPHLTRGGARKSFRLGRRSRAPWSARLGVAARAPVGKVVNTSSIASGGPISGPSGVGTRPKQDRLRAGAGSTTGRCGGVDVGAVIGRSRGGLWSILCRSEVDLGSTLGRTKGKQLHVDLGSI